MKKSIREFHSWVKAHPYKACLFAALTAALATWHGTRAYLTTFDLVPWGILLGLIYVFVELDLSKVRRGIPVLLAACLFCQPYQARARETRQPAAAGAIVAVVIIVIGGYIIFRVVRFCDHAFPRNPAPGTNNPPAVIFGAAHNYALASSCSALGTCYTAEPASLMQASSTPGTVLELSGEMEEAPQGGIAFRLHGAKKLEGEGETVDLMEFQRELQEWGVRFGSVGEVFYGVDGQPAGPDQVPIALQLNGTNPLVDASDPFLEHQAVVFERSSDLQHWEPILTLTVSVGQKVKFADAISEGQMFYRSRAAGD